MLGYGLNALFRGSWFLLFYWLLSSECLNFTTKIDWKSEKLEIVEIYLINRMRSLLDRFKKENPKFWDSRVSGGIFQGLNYANFFKSLFKFKVNFKKVHKIQIRFKNSRFKIKLIHCHNVKLILKIQKKFII